jgi:hypothetical protein
MAYKVSTLKTHGIVLKIAVFKTKLNLDFNVCACWVVTVFEMHVYTY